MSKFSFLTDRLKNLRLNLQEPELYELSIRQGEGKVAATGALAMETGVHTGRSAADKFIVCDAETENSIWWDNNKHLYPEKYEVLLEDFLAHAATKNLYCQNLYAGSDGKYRVNAQIFTELAWQSLFIRHLLIVPPAEDLPNYAPDFVVIALPSFQADPERHGVRSETVIACDFTRKLVLIGGSSYAGEIKKSVFTYLNYVLPPRDVLPMHCSASEELDGGNTAVFFGLSGTGKTTLSADHTRTLIGDDEHGWSENGIYNFEGGCYAKTVRLSPKNEPDIYAAANHWEAVLENVILHPKTRQPDFDDTTLTENTRAAYPLHFVPNASDTGCSGHPKNIVMLTADAFGVMPPIAKLTPAQAMYHFLSGYTAKVAGTEKGVTEPQATFSTCFGAPFMPRHPSVYGNLLRKLIKEHNVNCWLMNTGWTGGKYGVGHRMPLNHTRSLLTAALTGKLNNTEFRRDPVFGVEVPVAVEGVPTKLLDPRSTWADKAAYDEQARKLAKMFAENFKTLEKAVDEKIRLAGPVISR